MRAVLLLAAAAAAERTSWFRSSQKKEKPVTREGRAVQLARKVLEARTLEDAHSLARAAAQLLQTPSKSPPVNKRCSNPSLSRRDARGCQRVVASASARPLTNTALERGGFLCRALLVLEAAHHRGPASSKRDAHLGAIDAACAFDAKTWRPPPADQHARKIVVAIHHNGLGNQLFQWAFGKLVALDAGAAFAARKMREDEGPVRPQRVAPHTIEGWKAFTDVFGKASLGYQADAAAKCAPLIPVESQYREQGTLLLVERPADSRRLAFPKQVQNFASSLSDETQCISLLGYWQRYSLYAGLRPQLREAMRVQDGDLEERPDSDDVVVHVRLCDGPVHQYKYYSWKNYFSHVLPRLQPPPKRIKIVTACNPRRNGVVKDLLENVPNAEVAKPRLRGSPTTAKSVAADFAFMARAKRLVVTESTFSFWAAFLGDAHEVHAPSAGVLPAPLGEAGYVFHDVEAKAYWGLYNATARRVAYRYGGE
jgi:hypothetical protein